MPILVRVGMLRWAQPLSVPSKGRDGGGVMRLSSAMWLWHGGVVADPSLSIWPGLPD